MSLSHHQPQNLPEKNTESPFYLLNLQFLQFEFLSLRELPVGWLCIPGKFRSENIFLCLPMQSIQNPAFPSSIMKITH